MDMLKKTVSTLALILFSTLLLNSTTASAVDLDVKKKGRFFLSVQVAGKKIDLNQATAGEIRKHLKIPLKDANIIVANRKGKGYKNAQQLRAVKGLSKQTHDKLNKIQFGFGKGTTNSASSTSARPELL